MRLKDIRTRQAAIRARLAEIEATAEPAADADEAVRAAFDALPTEVDNLVAEFDTLEAEAAPLQARADNLARIRSASRVDEGHQAPAVHIRGDLFEGADRVRWMAPEDARSRALAAVEGVRYRGPIAAQDAARERAVNLIERDTTGDVARLALATSSPDYMSAFRAYIEAQGQPLYSPEQAAAVRASLSLTSANGGYTLPFLLDPTLINTGTATKNPVRRIARVETGTQNVWHGVTAGAVTTYWKAEGSAFTDGTGTMGGPSVTAAMLTAYVTGSFEIFGDSNLQAQLPGLIAEAIDFAEGDAFVVGSGSTAPKGVITAISATGIVTATTRGTFNSTSAVDTLALFNAAATRYEDTSQWMMNKTTALSIQQQTIGTAGSLVTEMTVAGTLLGSPLNKSSAMTATTTSGNFLAVYGDFSAFLVYDRLGTSVEFIPIVVDGSGLPTGQRGLVAYKRVGSDALDLNAFKILKA